MPKREEPELDLKEQFKRVKEAAKDLGAGQDTESIDRAFWRIARKMKQVSTTE